MSQKRFKQLLLLTIIIAGLTVFSGCVKKEKLSDEQNIKNIENKNNNLKKDNTPPVKSYKGEIFREEKGWKRYINKNFGIEFRFRDEGDELEVIDTIDEIVIGKKDDVWANPYVYIFFFREDGFNCHNKHQDNLKGYLQAGCWDCYEQSAELISIKELKNDNNVIFLEITAKVAEMPSILTPEAPLKYYTTKDYYVEYDNNNIDKNYIHINGKNKFPRMQEIISSFNFHS